MIEEKAVGRWLDILSSFGVDHRYLKNKHGPCPFCGGKDRYRFDNKEGRGTYYCSSCGSGDGWNFLSNMFNWSFKDAAKEVKSIIGECKQVTIQRKNPKTALKKIAELIQPIGKDSEIAKYLQGRGIKPSPKLREAMLYYWEDGKKLGPFPTMVALISDSEGKGISYHLTYTHRGVKAKVTSPKKIMTPVRTITGCAVKLHDHEEHICIAEGIETSLAAHGVCGLPAYSALNANCLANFEPPKGVTKVDIFGDNDKSFCGQRSAYVLAERLVKLNIEVSVHIPNQVGHDWLDTLGDKNE